MSFINLHFLAQMLLFHYSIKEILLHMGSSMFECPIYLKFVTFTSSSETHKNNLTTTQNFELFLKAIVPLLKTTRFRSRQYTWSFFFYACIYQSSHIAAIVVRDGLAVAVAAIRLVVWRQQWCSISCTTLSRVRLWWSVWCVFFVSTLWRGCMCRHQWLVYSRY